MENLGSKRQSKFAPFCLASPPDSPGKAWKLHPVPGGKMGLRHWRFGGGAAGSDLQIRSRNFNILGQTLDDSAFRSVRHHRTPNTRIIFRF
jgi:hypothetical protein